MRMDGLFLLAIIVTSWVIFIFNFVLGYYIGRAVEAGEKSAKKGKAAVKRNKDNEQRYNTQIYPSSVQIM